MNYLFMSYEHATVQNNYIRAANNFSENCGIMGMTVTNQNCIRKEIKSRLNSGNTCCHAVQNL
jgi:hypothetical protein